MSSGIYGRVGGRRGGRKRTGEGPCGEKEVEGLREDHPPVVLIQ